MRAAHVHFARTNSQEQFPRDRIATVDAIQNRRLGVERQIAANSHRDFVVVENVSRAAKSVGADAETRIIIGEPQQRAITWAQQLILIHQFQSRIKIVPVAESCRRLKRITVQIVDLGWAAGMVPAPDESRSPIATMKRSVVLH